MPMTKLLATLIVCVAAAGCQSTPTAVAPGKSEPPDGRVRTIADAYLNAYFDRNPESVTLFGIAGKTHDRLTDNSLAALETWQKQEDDFLRQVRDVNPTSIENLRLRATYAIARESLESSIASRRCRTELWNVSEMTGWHTNLGYIVTIQPVGNDQARQAALARWGSLPAYIDNEIANAREGLKRGFRAPKGNVTLVIDEIRALVDAPVKDSPFASPATRDGSPEFQKTFTTLVTEKITPAAKRYLEFLEKEYLPAARDGIAVADNPDGAACYQASIRAYSSLPKSPKEVHDIGVKEMERLTAEMQTIAERSFKTTDLPELFQRLRVEKQYLFKDRKDLLQYSQAALDRAKGAAPQWFGLLPQSAVKLEPYPAFREKSGPSEYNPPAEDGSHPGLYYVSAYQAEKKSKVTVESTAFHETIPGHHLQVALALERKEIHPIGRYIYNSGFVEGWALYAEELADEMTLFSSDLDRLGMLGSQALRAARLVVDTGIHSMGWSRQQAIDYMLTHTPESSESVSSEVDRYIILPGQATAYMLGRIEIQAARDEAKKAMAARFDIKAFHDRVLEDGSVPLTFLREKITNWTNTRGDE
jgi:uncharacterized protein (DUF885 family)